MARTRRKKKRTHVPTADGGEPGKKQEPKTFVIKRGKLASVLGDLEQDVRRMMMPNTANNLRESRRNTLRDFVSVAGPLGVTHLMVLSATERSSYLKVGKLPRGPTLALRINRYSLIRDVQAAASRPRVPANAFKTAPLVVMNGFSGDETLRLVTTMFQGAFPAINVQRTKLSSCQRVVLISQDKATGVIRLRHYGISVTPSGLKKSIKQLLSRRDVPDLGRLQDVAEFVTKSGYGSESEGEDAEAGRVTLSEDLGRGNAAARQSRVRLHEIGPRLDMQLVKIEEGLCEGAVLHHAHVSKTAEQAAALADRKEESERLRAERRKQQEANVRRKAAEAGRKAAEHAEAARAAGKIPKGQKMWWEKQLPAAGDGDEDDGQAAGGGGGGGAADLGGAGAGTSGSKRGRGGEDDDDDAEYFREEVGRAPDADELIGGRRTPYGGRSFNGGRRGGRGGGRGRGRGGGRSGPQERYRPGGDSGGGRRGGRGQGRGDKRQRQ